MDKNFVSFYATLRNNLFIKKFKNVLAKCKKKVIFSTTKFQ